ncbi:MAG: hypothetical protein OXM03_13530 [Chloroflexota bacterium]|nr:hypothetical protein [Chloroflexota bacterium]MDE2841643.1 hypothetical protein [Chloroflexota bacterium]MDE2931466.1 hypothetical protein [Chloroflexota bacterium]
MDVIRKLLAVYLSVVALLVAVHFVFNSFYRDSLDVIDVWNVLDWPMALAIVIALVVHCQRKFALKREADQAISREYVEANVAVYVTTLVALWFFSNWFTFLNLGSEGESVANVVVWAFVDALIVLVLAATGHYLWRSGADT